MQSRKHFAHSCGGCGALLPLLTGVAQCSSLHNMADMADTLSIRSFSFSFIQLSFRLSPSAKAKWEDVGLGWEQRVRTHARCDVCEAWSRGGACSAILTRTHAMQSDVLLVFALAASPRVIHFQVGAIFLFWIGSPWLRSTWFQPHEKIGFRCFRGFI